MHLRPQDLITYLIAGCVFGLVLFLWLAWVVLWAARRSGRKKEIGRRLGTADNAPAPERVLRLWQGKDERTTVVPGMARQHVVWAWLEERRRAAGWETPVQTIMLQVFTGLAFAGTFALLLTGSVLVGVFTAMAVFQMFWIWLNQCASRRQSAFERQLVDALELAARSLRAGHPLSGSFQLIAQEVPAPVGPIFAEINQQQGLGLAMEQAIRRAAVVSNSQDFQLFATSVVIQIRAGGNLADLMERLALVMRERMRLARRVRVLTAQTQFSKRVLIALPVIIFLLLNLLNHKYMEPLYATSTGQIMLTMAGGGLLLGAWVMNRLSVLKT